MSSDDTDSRITINVPADRPVRTRWSPALVKFPLGRVDDGVLRSHEVTRVVEYMGFDAADQATPQRGLVIKTPAARFSGTATLPPATWSSDAASLVGVATTPAAAAAAAAAAVADDDDSRKRSRSVESSERFVVARFEPAKKRLTLVDVGAPFTLQPFQHPLVGDPDAAADDDDADDAEADAAAAAEAKLSAGERRMLLTKNFGTRKRLLEMERKANSAVRLGTSMSGAAATVAALETRAAETRGTVEVTASLANLPPINRETSVLADVFDIHGIVTPEINSFLEAGAKYRETEELCSKLFRARATARRFNGAYPDKSLPESAFVRDWYYGTSKFGGFFTANQFAEASQIADRKEAVARFKLLYVLSAIVKFHRTKFVRGTARTVDELSKMSSVHDGFMDILCRTYCAPADSPIAGDTRQYYQRTALLADKLAAHIIILMLHLNGFEVALADVTSATNFSAPKARSMLRFLSCFPTSDGEPVSQLNYTILKALDAQQLEEGPKGPYRVSYKLTAPFKEMKAAATGSGSRR